MARAKKRKRFFDVEIPLIKKETHLQAYELKDLEGRFMKYDLTRILKGKGMILQSKVKIEGEKAIATSIGIRLMPYFLKRMVRKGTNYVEDSFSTKCKDTNVEIKPFLITRRKVSRKVRKALREEAKKRINKLYKKQNCRRFIRRYTKRTTTKIFKLKT